MNSETPRSDTFLKAMGERSTVSDEWIKLRDFARQLERELAAKEKERDSWHTLFRQVDSYACALIKDGAAQKESVLGTIMEHVARQEKELAELRGVFDFLEVFASPPNIWPQVFISNSQDMGYKTDFVSFKITGKYKDQRKEFSGKGNSLKEAIQAAMKGQNEC